MKSTKPLRCAVVAALLVFGLGSVLFSLRHDLLKAMGAFLVVADEPQQADAIVVLSGSIPDRILEAVDLYHAGFAPRLLLTREGRMPGFDALRARGVALPERHEQNRDIAVALGVPRDAIEIVERRSTSTLAEAEALVAFLRERNLQRVLLVTSRSHARRARTIFRALAGSQPEILVVPSRYDPLTPDNWWQKRAFARRVVTEYGKLLTWWVIDRWRTRSPG
jgi:uncharacterized SAM-binding protein YcdF (DUF218 family)